jgi:hypothetical protein
MVIFVGDFKQREIGAFNGCSSGCPTTPSPVDSRVEGSAAGGKSAVLIGAPNDLESQDVSGNHVGFYDEATAQLDGVANLGGLVEAALEISRRRREIMIQLRAALQGRDCDEALRLASKLCGLEK